VKDGDLYMGSMGKEYTNPDGSIANTNNMWVSRYTKKGELMREDWTDKYNFVRNRLGAENPGYVINEAILWSDHLKSWVFLPRRVSSDAYDENKDERMGSSKICIVSEGFDSAKVIDIKFRTQDPLHGFSTFAFVPNTNDRHALAVRSVEEDCVGGDANMCKQRSYFTVFDVLTGEVLMEEQQFPENIKFEGIEFVNIYTS
jgi:soluble calcium-activated nucleotidase 1